jgi:CMP-N,N'-diacetyllegionaminic acid synthase
MIAASICVRGGSKGVPGKNKRQLNGRPLIDYTIECAKNTPEIGAILVSTDDDELAALAEARGIPVPFRRPADLASDTASKWPVFIHLLETYEKNSGNRIDILLDLDVTVPLRSPEDITGCLQVLRADPSLDVAITAYDAERNPYFNMVEMSGESRATIVKVPSVPFVRRQDAPRVYSLTPAVFAIRREALYTYSHWSQSRFSIYPMPRDRAVDIDTEIDFKFVEFLMTHDSKK